MSKRQGPLKTHHEHTQRSLNNNGLCPLGSLFLGILFTSMVLNSFRRPQPPRLTSSVQNFFQLPNLICNSLLHIFACWAQSHVRFNVSKTEHVIFILTLLLWATPFCGFGLRPDTCPRSLGSPHFLYPYPSPDPSPGPVNSPTKIYLRYTDNPFISFHLHSHAKPPPSLASTVEASQWVCFSHLRPLLTPNFTHS